MTLRPVVTNSATVSLSRKLNNRTATRAIFFLTKAPPGSYVHGRRALAGLPKIDPGSTTTMLYNMKKTS